MRVERQDIPLRSSRLTIAIIQVEGGFPNGKHLTLVDGRLTYTWKDPDEIARRTTKALRLLEAIATQHPQTNIVIFPEYSLPLVKSTITELQKVADQHSFLIIPGADNLRQRPGHFYNQSTVLVPGAGEPVVYEKAEVSDWEKTHVDERLPTVNRLLTWRADGKSYWLSVRICFDLLMAPREQEFDEPAPGVVFVPLSSPDIITFRAYADILLRARYGRAVVLCNALGHNAVGGSSVIAMSRGATILDPAVVLSSHQESVAVVEVDCANLSPPRKTPVPVRAAIGSCTYFHINNEHAQAPLVQARPENPPTASRAVLNPWLFEISGKKMRLAFLRIYDLPAIEARSRNQSFEVLAVLGQHDILVSHVEQARERMYYDLETAFGTLLHESPTSLRHGTDGHLGATGLAYPFFGVDTFYKVLGEPVLALDRAVFDHPDQQPPRRTELEQLLALGRDWDDPNVPESARQRFVESRWILGKTSKVPGQVDAILSLSLHYSGAITEPQENFRLHVLPKLVANNAVTSIYGGTGTDLKVDYVLRISSDVRSLFELIEEVHRLAQAALVSIRTSTCVVLRKLADLSLEDALLAPGMPPDEARYADKRILPHLSNKDKKIFRHLSAEDQEEIISYHRQAEEALNLVSGLDWMAELAPEVRKGLARGLLHRDFNVMREPHNLLQAKVEEILSIWIESSVTDADIAAWKGPMPLQHDRKHLSYSEKIRVVSRMVKDKRLPPEAEEDIVGLAATIQIRNAITHQLRDKLTMQDFLSALLRYCTFIHKWGV